MPPTMIMDTAKKAKKASLPKMGPLSDEKAMSFLQLLNISIGFLGIQFAWAVQMGQMSPLLETLGSDPRMTGFISCAGPVTGVLVQPIVGILSDRCKSTLGRRRPFLLAGAVLTAISLIFMPNVSALWMAAVLLWILDASINLSQGPYRALVPDVVPKNQQATAYSLMSLTIGLGSVAAFLIGYVISDMQTLFYLGASAMLLAMAWTSLTTPEQPPQAGVLEESNTTHFFADMISGILSMPREGLKLCLAHSFTWFGLMCLFVFFSLYVPHHIFGAASPESPGYREGVQWVSLCYAAMNIVCFLFSMVIGKFTDATSKKTVHTMGLILMTLSLGSMAFISTPTQVLIAMALIGVGWATTLSLPFALLSDHLPRGREGVLMGTFNIFIAAPGVISNLAVGPLVAAYNDNYAVAMIAGAVAMVVSAFMLQFVKETQS